ncbi:MAG: pyridoxamine 5'-phosphate oxidase family protein [Microgenomates group bacterium]
MKPIEHISDFIKSNTQMTIATYGDSPWIATVYYSSDDALNLYFLSDPDTIHCHHIKVNPNVAVSIADSPQAPSSNKIGLQISGIAEQISDKKKIVHALDLWRKTLGVTSNAYTYAGMMKKAIKGRMFKVTPNKIKFFNEELWEEGSEPVVELN